MKVLLIVPAYNEEKSIKRTVDGIIAAGYDYVVINDGSTDKTKTILTENNYNYIDLITNLGIGGAIQTGYKYALKYNYDIAIQFDADGQHDLDSIPSLIEPIVQDKADFVIGSRFIKKSGDNFKSSFMRRVGIRLISNIIFIFSRKRIYDTTSGFRAGNRKIIRLFANDYPLEYPEPISEYELIRMHYRLLEVPTTMHQRIAGKSSIHSWKSAYYIINVVLSIIIISLRRKHERNTN